MIGQKNVLNMIDKLIDNGFPRFVVITGQKGQGKTELSKYIISKLNYNWTIIGTKVDEIREMIDFSYKQTEPILYLIYNADKMSLNAKNSLLKVIEEPPNNAYFIMTLTSIENTLSTIRSRCQLIEMEPYSEEEINNFINELNPIINPSQRHILLSICRNKYEIELLIKYGIDEFYNYVKKVVDNIYKVQSANSFKLTEKLDIKNDGNGYDLDLFLETYKSICLNYLTNDIDNENFDYYAKGVQITSLYQHKLNITGINRQSLIDMWILSIRKIWRE